MSGLPDDIIEGELVLFELFPRTRGNKGAILSMIGAVLRIDRGRTRIFPSWDRSYHSYDVLGSDCVVHNAIGMYISKI